MVDCGGCAVDRNGGGVDLVFLIFCYGCPAELVTSSLHKADTKTLVDVRVTAHKIACDQMRDFKRTADSRTHVSTSYINMLLLVIVQHFLLVPASAASNMALRHAERRDAFASFLEPLCRYRAAMQLCEVG
eukprot:IDg19626t1